MFPLASFAAALVHYAVAEGTAAARGLAWAAVGCSVGALVFVFGRMSAHHLGVVRGVERWGDPVADAWWLAGGDADPWHGARGDASAAAAAAAAAGTAARSAGTRKQRLRVSGEAATCTLPFQVKY